MILARLVLTAVGATVSWGERISTKDGHGEPYVIQVTATAARASLCALGKAHAGGKAADHLYTTLDKTAESHS